MEKDKTIKVDAKEMLKNLALKQEKIRFDERKALEIIKETEFYKEGQIINPHITFANVLIEKGIAKEYKQ